MFSETQKTAYHSVKAPDALRSRVLDMADETPRRRKRPAYRRMTAAAAACLMLVMLMTALLPKSGAEILTGGSTIGSEPVAVSENGGIALARAAETLSLPLTVKPHGRASLTLSHGVLRSGDTIIAARCEIDSPAELIWEIEAPDTAETYELRIDCGEERSVLTLAFDAEENCWTVFAAEE